MAVYTEVTDEDLTAFLDQYDLGQVTAFKGIAEGVENSNYLLRTTVGSYILTLYEKREVFAEAHATAEGSLSARGSLNRTFSEVTVTTSTVTS